MIRRIQVLSEFAECEREVILPLAQQHIALALDDGVKTKSHKFPGLLAKIPRLEKEKDE